MPQKSEGTSLDSMFQPICILSWSSFVLNCLHRRKKNNLFPQDEALITELERNEPVPVFILSGIGISKLYLLYLLPHYNKTLDQCLFLLSAKPKLNLRACFSSNSSNTRHPEK